MANTYILHAYNMLIQNTINLKSTSITICTNDSSITDKTHLQIDLIFCNALLPNEVLYLEYKWSIIIHNKWCKVESRDKVFCLQHLRFNHFKKLIIVYWLAIDRYI